MALGDLIVRVGGNIDGFKAAMVDASATATQFTSKIAASVSEGVTLFDQFGRAVETRVTAPVRAAAAPLSALQLLLADIAAAENVTAASAERLAAAHGHAVSQIQATSGAIRVFEGNSALRASERFVATTLGLGPALQAVFPIIGGLAFIEMIGRIGEKIAKLAKLGSDSGEVIRDAFRQLNDDAKISNDSLQVSNDKLENEIAKIEHKPENGIKLALDEAILSADQLAKSLDKDLSALNKLLTENKVGILSQVFGDAPTADIEDDIKKFQRKVAAVSGSGAIPRQESVGGVSILAPDVLTHRKDAAQLATNTQLTALFTDEIDKLSHQLQTARTPSEGAVDPAKRIETLTGAIANLREQAKAIGLKVTNANLEGDKLEAQQNAGNAPSLLITNQEQANTRLAALSTLQVTQAIADEHRKRQAQIDGIENVHARSVASAEEAVRMARETEDQLIAINERAVTRQIDLIRQKAAADSAGKTPGQQGDIRIKTDGEIAAARGATDEKNLELAGRFNEALGKLDEVRVTNQRQSFAEFQAEAKKEQSFLSLMADEANTGIAKSGLGIVEAGAKNTTLGAKGKADQDEAQAAKDKLLAERAYGLQVFHTAAQQIAQMQLLAQFDSASMAAKEGALRVAAEQAAIVALISGDYKDGEKALEAQNAYSKLLTEDENKRLQTETKILELKKQHELGFQIKGDVAHAAQQLPGALGGSLAKGIFDGGKNIGKDIANSLKNVGQQLLGNVLTHALEKMAAEVIANTAIGVWLGTTFGTTGTAQVAASTANTVALTANTAALGIHAGVSAAGGIASGAGSAAGAASSAVSTAAGGLVGPLIAAAGGVIGGVISGVMSLIGAHQVVKAIHETTAAVNALGTRGFLNTGTLSGTGPVKASLTGAQPAAPASGGMNGVLNDVMNHIFGSTNSAQGVAVRIVGIGQASSGGTAGLLEGLFGFGGGDALPVKIVHGNALGQGGLGSFLKGIAGGFFPGFADGGIPPLGVPSMVGERGPELFIPHQLGTIIPNHQLKAFAASNPVGASFSSSSQSSSATFGDLHFHGVQNVHEMMRSISRVVKNGGLKFSPYAT